MPKCSHLDQICEISARAKGCEECLQPGSWWVHLRMCLSCGHVGCCDSSPGKHAAKHFHDTGQRLSNPSSRARISAGVTLTGLTL